MTFVECFSLVPEYQTLRRIVSANLLQFGQQGVVPKTIKFERRVGGTLNSGDTYMIYVKSGMSIPSLAASRNDGSVDIIRKIWVFHPTVYITDII